MSLKIATVSYNIKLIIIISFLIKARVETNPTFLKNYPVDLSSNYHCLNIFFLFLFLKKKNKKFYNEEDIYV